MEGELQYQGQIDQDLEEWLYPRWSQSVHSFFFEEEKQESIRIEDSAPKRARIATMVNIAPSGAWLLFLLPLELNLLSV